MGEAMGWEGGGQGMHANRYLVLDLNVSINM